jgi:hypothetical protein
MPIHQHRPSDAGATNGGDMSTMIEKVEELAAADGDRFLPVDAASGFVARSTS